MAQATAVKIAERRWQVRRGEAVLATFSADAEQFAGSSDFHIGWSAKRLADTLNAPTPVWLA